MKWQNIGMRDAYELNEFQVRRNGGKQRGKWDIIERELTIKS